MSEAVLSEPVQARASPPQYSDEAHHWSPASILSPLFFFHPFSIVKAYNC